VKKLETLLKAAKDEAQEAKAKALETIQDKDEEIECLPNQNAAGAPSDHEWSTSSSQHSNADIYKLLKEMERKVSFFLTFTNLSLFYFSI